MYQYYVLRWFCYGRWLRADYHKEDWRKALKDYHWCTKQPEVNKAVLTLRCHHDCGTFTDKQVRCWERKENQK